MNATAAQTKTCFLSAKKMFELAGAFGTPAYFYDQQIILDTAKAISSSISYPRTRFHFACVTNGNPALIRLYKSLGWGLHANTPGDVHLGFLSGMRGEDIVFSGSNLTNAEIKYMIDNRVATLNLDSLSQLQSFCLVFKEMAADAQLNGTEPPEKPRLGFRLNLPEITGSSRIGLSPEMLGQAVDFAGKYGHEIVGVHFYRGTGTNANERYNESIERILEIAQTLPDLAYVDFGGGFGFQYNSSLRGFNWQEFGKILSSKIENLARPIDLIIEPGRSAIASAGILHASVVSCKFQDDRQIVGVDTSVSNLAVLSVHGGYREVISASCNNATKAAAPSLDKSKLLDKASGLDLAGAAAMALDRKIVSKNLRLYDSDVSGNTTFSRDYLAKKCLLPLLKPGDLIAVLDSGAYGFAMTSHFLHRTRPPEILLNGEKYLLIRRRETVGDLCSTLVSEMDIEKKGMK